MCEVILAWPDLPEALRAAVPAIAVPVDRAAYIGKYLSNEREPCLKRWRLWAGFGEWEWSKVKDILLETPRAKIYAACKAFYGWQGKGNFFQRMQIVDEAYLTTLKAADPNRADSVWFVAGNANMRKILDIPG